MKYLLIILLAFTSLRSFAQEDVATRKKHFLIEKGVAISGYDPVSYFKGKPQKGKISFDYQGISYRFANDTNLEAFKKSPQKYEPAYGGWCAYAMGAKNKKVDVDPTNFKITNGVLYLFYKDFFSNTLDDWNEAEVTLTKQANINWKNTIK